LNTLSTTLNSPRLLASVNIELRVIPGRIVPSSGGVINSSYPSSFFQKAKIFIVPTSVT
jgi:hypothetical protein